MLPYKLVSWINFDSATEIIANSRQHLFGKCICPQNTESKSRSDDRESVLQYGPLSLSICSVLRVSPQYLHRLWPQSALMSEPRSSRRLRSTTAAWRSPLL